MTQPKRYEIQWGDRPLIIEFGKLAGQATSACTVQYGETTVLATVVMAPSNRELNYFPLTVEYKENLYAAGKISGSRFVKREGRPTDQSILSARIIDRSIRPLFDQSIRQDLQVVLTVFSYDETSDPDVVGLIGAAAALVASPIPWAGPLAGCVVSHHDGKMHLNASTEVTNNADLNIFVSSRTNAAGVGEMVMLEADGKEVTEDVTLQAIEYALQQLTPVNALLKQIQQELGQPKLTPPAPTTTAEAEAIITSLKTKTKEHFEKNWKNLFGPGNKQDRKHRYQDTLAAFTNQLTEDELVYKKIVSEEFERLFSSKMVERIFSDGVRVDDRKLDEIRTLTAEVGVIPRVHGSALFTRGDTQVLSIVTLSSPSSEQIFDTMRLDEKRRYFHHYNFPPYSVGEAGPFRGPGRREIGHGALAEKSVFPVLPKKADFPYTIRAVSEVLSSNGSSSQGSACGSSLALMDAGVPIKAAVAGIAMGIAFRGADKTDYRILTDVQDVEDYSQSMDFKVAGTRQGITAIQLDIKFDGLTLPMIKDTLERAKAGRLQILTVMDKALAAPRPTVSRYAPQIETIQINKAKIGELIGPGGKVINGIIEKTGVAIDIEEDGTVFITAEPGANMAEAIQLVEDITREVEVGQTYTGTVVKIVADRTTQKEIGAIVELFGQTSGMIHISQVANERINKVSDVLKEGDQVKVKVLEIDQERGRIALSRKALLS